MLCFVYNQRECKVHVYSLSYRIVQLGVLFLSLLYVRISMYIIPVCIQTMEHTRVTAFN